MKHLIKFFFFLFLLEIWCTSLYSQSISIYFNSGGYNISDTSKAKLDDFYNANFLSSQPHVFLKGYSDTSGTTQLNFEISKSRVNSVKEYLISKGFPTDNIKFEYFGEETVNEDAPWLSRRVDFLIDSNLSVYDNLPKLKKPEQVFLINNKKDTILYGNEGTKIFIPANSFQTIGGKKVFEIQITLTEYYKMEDMLTSKLTTVTDKNEILETRGMINIIARANGEECQINKSSKISVSFPNIKDPDGFKLYQGKEDAEEINWNSENTVDAIEYKVSIHMSGFIANEIGFNDIFANHLRENLYYPISALQKGVCGLLRIKFNINSTGEINEINIQDEGLYPEIDNLVMQVLREMPPLNPAFKSDRRNLKHFYLCVIAFSSDKCKARYKTPSHFTPTWIIQNPSPSGPDSSFLADVNNISDVIYTTSNLGWLNVDKLIPFFGNDANIKVNYQPSYNIDFKIVLNDSRSIIRGRSTKDKYLFYGVPKNQKGTLIGLKYENDKIYLVKKEISTDKMTLENIEFREVTVSELRHELMNL